MYENIQRGTYSINGTERYFRSKWEANYALYLDFLKAQGQIKEWKYEPRFFDFPVKHGVTRYLPDFQVFNNNGTDEFHEVKGFLDSKSKTKMKRMTKYYPEVKLLMIDMAFMRSLKQYEKLLKFY